MRVSQLERTKLRQQGGTVKESATSSSSLPVPQANPHAVYDTEASSARKYNASNRGVPYDWLISCRLAGDENHVDASKDSSAGMPLLVECADSCTKAARLPGSGSEDTGPDQQHKHKHRRMGRKRMFRSSANQEHLGD